MTDKERILTWIVSRVYRKALYDPVAVKGWRDMQPLVMGGKGEPIQAGDLVVGMTTLKSNEFLVGFVHGVAPDCVVIREIGSDRLCNYSNEDFLRIDKEMLGYEILEGVQYQIYQKVLKAFAKSNLPEPVRFRSIVFDGKICTVEARKKFESEALFSISFEYNRRTSIKSIVDLIEREYEEE